MEIENCITGLTVVYNTKDLIERAYNSIRRFHPNMKLIIVDGSDKNGACFNYLSTISKEKNTRLFHSDKNIGHGRGLCVGLSHVKTPFVLVFDSDIEMLKSPLQTMLNMMEDDTYGVGYTEKTAFDGFEWGCKPVHKTQGWMRYLHPYFCLIQMKEYKKYKPFIHHGAPAVNTMLDIHRRGLGDKIIKEFPGLGHSSGVGWVWKGEPREFIRHDTYGTRAYRRSKGLEEIEGVWDRVIDDGMRLNNGITCITCTGDRQLAFSLCHRWIVGQILKPYQWLIVDDGITPIDTSTLPKYADYVRRLPTSKDPKHTMLLNLREAFKRIRGSKIMFIEDDEYYAPEYIDIMSKKLDKYKLAGIGRSKYYFLPFFKYGVHSNMGHASLAQTAFDRSLLNHVQNLLSGDTYLDIRIWNMVNGQNASSATEPANIREMISADGRGIIFDDRDNSLYAGIKGMPGRRGIGSGHNGKMTWYNIDKDKKVLKNWIRKEDDFNLYIDLVSKNEEMKAKILESNKLVGK